ncbi:chaplin [Micromonospora sp. CPCC 205371]|nr:chaplin [Micromonospora sp. CPCC 205371]
MKTWVRKTLSVGVLAAGALLFAPGAAQAEISQISVGNDGVLNGNQAAVPIQVPVNVCGNGVGVVGVGVGVSGVCVNGAAHDIGDDDRNGKGKHKYKESSRTEGATQFSWDNDGVLNGNQAYVPIQIPVNVCGNGVGVVGVGVGISGACVNGAAHDIEESARAESSRTEGALQFSGDNDGVLNGNQIYVPIQVPVNICGNGVGVVGVGVGLSGACFNGAAHDIDDDRKSRKGKESSRTEDALQFSGDNDGVLNGNQIYVPIQVPINICGNGVGVVGVGLGVSGACFNGAAHDIEESERTEGLAQISGDNDGVLNGNQIAVPIQVPINVCGNGVGVVGVGVGISGACVNGAAWDIDDDDKNGNGNGNHHYKKNKKDRDGYERESLPLLGDLPALGGSTGSSLGGATQELPVAGALGSGVKTSKVNVGGVDPMALLSQVPTA